MKYERHHIADIIIDDEQASKDGREVSVFVDTHEQVNIEIGTSLVIRTGYQGLHSLRHILDDASAKLDQMIYQNQKEVEEVDQEEKDLTGNTYVVSNKDWLRSDEAYFIQQGIDAREKLKKLRRSEQQTVDVWNPNDPSNW